MRAMAALAVGALVLGGCTNDTGEPVPVTASPTATPSPSPRASAEAPSDPYAVPDEITPEYVEEVYAALAKLEAEAIEAYRTHVENGGPPDLPPKEAVDRFRAIYSDEMFPAMMVTWQQVAGEGFEGLKENLGQAYLVVDEVLNASPSCIVVIARHDLTETAVSPGEDLQSYIAFVSSVDESRRLNATPWELHYERLTSGSAPDEHEPCAR